MGPIFGRNHSQVYPHMRAKFGHDRSSSLAAYTRQTHRQNLYYIDIDRYIYIKHFMDLFSSVNNSTHRKYVMDSLSEVSAIQTISPDGIENVLKQLKSGKSAGADHIHAEHVIHASDTLTVLLSILCNYLMKHGYIHSGMLDTPLTHIVKAKTT